MASFFGSQKPVAQQQQQPSYTALPTQTSSYGKSIPIIFGRARMAPNLGWYDGFTAVSHVTETTQSGGKGGSSTTSSNTTYTYTVNVIFLIGEGPISDIVSVWEAQSITSPSALGFDVVVGTIGQAPWSFLSSNFPAAADPYSGIAYAGASPLQLGTSANLANYNFEVDGLLAGTAANGIDARPELVVSSLLSNPQFGAGFTAPLGAVIALTETFTISGPVTVSQHAHFVKPLSVSVDGVVLTCTTNTPSTTQYSVASGVYTFNATHGTVATITYAYQTDLSDYSSFCTASGLWISPVYDSSTTANSMLSDIVKFTNGEFVWSQGSLSIIPRGTVAITANGATFTPPAAPLFDLNDEDFRPIAAGSANGSSNDPLIVNRSRTADQENQIKVEYLDRSAQYAPAILETSDEALISISGTRFTGTKTAHMFCDGNAARASAQFLLQNEYIRNTFNFTLDQRWIILDPMDIVTVSDSGLGLDRQWVRITEITENADGSLDIVAEEYLDGTGAAALHDINQGFGHQPDFNIDPGFVNFPAIFEAPVEIAATSLEIWCAVSGASSHWGGCDVFISSDGANYTFLGEQIGPARMGTLSATFPAGPDPDEDNVLAVDLTESFGQLNSGTLTEAQQGLTLCWVDSELISYEIAQLTSLYHYNLESYLRRGLGGTTITTHAAGSLFVRLDDSTLIKVPYASGMIGTTLWLKFVSFNIYMGGQQSLADVPAYTHKILGPPPPGMVQNFNVSQTTGNSSVIFTWTDLEDFALKGYDILYGPVGGTVDNAFELTIASRTTEMTNASVPKGSWIFYIRGHDIVNQLGVASTMQFTVVDSGGSILQEIASPDWLGLGTTGAVSGFTLATLTSGTSFPVPTGVTSVTVQAIGPGGAGSVGAAGSMGYGGGGGGFAQGTVAIAPGTTSVPIQIAPGLPTTFGNPAVISAAPGGNATTSAPGAGGTNNVGQIVFPGGNGGSATAGQGGGGGGSAGASGPGANAIGGTGGAANGGAVPGAAAINPNLLSTGNQFDGAQWTKTGASIAIEAGVGPVTLTFGAGQNFLLSSPQFTPLSNTTYTVSAQVSGPQKFRFGGDDGNGGHFAPSGDITPNGTRQSWTITTGTVGSTSPAGFGLISDLAGDAASYVISYFKVEIGSVMTWNANDGLLGTEYGTAGASSGAGAGGDSAAGGKYGGGAGGVAQSTTVFDPASFGGNLLTASNNLSDPVWIGFPHTSVNGSIITFTSLSSPFTSSFSSAFGG